MLKSGQENLEILKWGRLRNIEKKKYSSLRIRTFHIPAFSTKTGTNKPKPQSLPLPKKTSGYSRRVIVKVSYKQFKPDNLTEYRKGLIQANTKDAVEYFYRFDGKTGFSHTKDSVSKDEALIKFDKDAIFKVIISPEDPDVLDKAYIRSIMANLERQSGKSLEWVAIFHDEGDHPHAHIMISRTKSEGCSWEAPLKLDSFLISEGIRKYAEHLSTRILGPKSVMTYRKPFIDSIEKIGLARIDHIIAGNPRRGTNLFIPATDTYYLLDKSRLNKLPKWQQQLIEKRLTFLSKIEACGFKKIAGEWRCYNPYGWKDALIDKEKLLPFSALQDKYGPIVIDKANRDINSTTSYSGTVLEHIIIDDNSQKLGLIIQDTNGRLHYVESEMEYPDSRSINGKAVEVKPRESRTKGYKLPEVHIQGKKR